MNVDMNAVRAIISTAGLGNAIPAAGLVRLVERAGASSASPQAIMVLVGVVVSAVRGPRDLDGRPAVLKRTELLAAIRCNPLYKKYSNTALGKLLDKLAAAGCIQAERSQVRATSEFLNDIGVAAARGPAPTPAAPEVVSPAVSAGAAKAGVEGQPDTANSMSPALREALVLITNDLALTMGLTTEFVNCRIEAAAVSTPESLVNAAASVLVAYRGGRPVQNLTNDLLLAQRDRNTFRAINALTFAAVHKEHLAQRRAEIDAKAKRAWEDEIFRIANEEIQKWKQVEAVAKSGAEAQPDSAVPVQTAPAHAASAAPAPGLAANDLEAKAETVASDIKSALEQTLRFINAQIEAAQRPECPVIPLPVPHYCNAA
jgi:hypothetical protein